MAFKQNKHIFTGMSRDLSDDKQKAEYYIEAHNIRITAREDTTLLSVTNEKGNESVVLTPEDGINFTRGQYIGHAVLNDYLVLFTKEVYATRDTHPDTIWRINLKTNESKRLYYGELGFSRDNPIETLVDYETDEVQKVYWTDGDNQPRVINIVNTYTYTGSGIDSQFDFVPEVYPDGVDTLSVNIEKLTGTEGTFVSGTIQYFITYYNKFGQESNVVWQSPLLYISPADRGGSPNETISNSFRLNISNPTGNFDYIRIYAVQHTSEDTDLIGRRVIDLPINNSIIYIDNGTSGESIVPSDLYYKGGVPTAVGTMTAKDQTLFLGNITIKNKQAISERIKETVKNLTVSFDLRAAYPAEDAQNKLYDYYNQLNENNQTQLVRRIHSTSPNATIPITHTIASYKYLETYRFGLQFQDKYGQWSEPVYIGDFQNTVAPELGTVNNIPYIYLPVAILSSDLAQEFLDELNTNYVKVRPLVVLPKENERECVAQGVVCPTVYNLGDRKTNSPYAQPSWFFRPYEGSSLEYGMGLAYKHNAIIQGKTSKIAEIEKAPEMQIPPTEGATYYEEGHPDWGLPGIGDTIYANKALSDNNFFVDQSLITLNSPDIEFNTNFAESDYGFRVIGIIDVTGFTGSMQLQTSNAPNNFYRTEEFGSQTNLVGYGEPTIKEVAEGYLNTRIQQYNISNAGYGIMGSGGWWYDTPYTEWVTKNSSSTAATSGYIYPSGLRYHFKIFPWQAAGSLNNTSNKTSFETAGTNWTINPNTADLRYKVIANLRYSSHTKYLINDVNNLLYEITDAQVADPNINSTLQLQGPREKRTYYCNVDKLLPAPKNTVRQMLNEVTYTDWSIINDPTFKKIYDWDIFIESAGLSTYSEHYPDLYSTNGGQVLRHHMAIHVDYNGGCLRYSGSGSGIQPSTQIHNNAILSTKTTATSITYRSNRHLAINLKDYALQTYTILPRIKFNSGTERVVGDLYDEHWTYGVGPYNESTQVYDQVGNRYVWDSNYVYNNTAAQKTITISDNDFYNKGVLLLGELYRKTITNKYGGDTEDAIQQNLWIPAGESISLNNINSSTNSLMWKEGDTYFQRYDCLKTYPYSNESENNIVEILSFMCETRTNIAGRYDKNRGLLDNTYITNENFNLMNNVYTQHDNFFSYRILDERFDTSVFRNQLTWSKVKSAGALIDNWTSISLANTLDLDGDKGEITSLNRYKNEIIAFQPKGISRIIFNPNVQISTESGIPIELANSGKVQGKMYLYEGVGCTNKWSICDEVYGSLYFIDNLAKSIFKLSDQGLVSLTDTKGFREWMQTVNTTDVWTPYPLNHQLYPELPMNFRTFYDKTYKDIYFVNADTTMVYSDLLGQFVSFMDYQLTNGMFNIGDNFYALYEGNIWQQFAGPYNRIYDEYRDYDITFIENQNPELSKIFTNLEFRSDTYDSSNNLLDFETFDTVRVFNEYQDTDDKPVNKLMGIPEISNLQKKFRIWRLQIPRDKNSWNQRISNTWAKITLKKNVTSLHSDKKNHKTVLHDAITGYYF